MPELGILSLSARWPRPVCLTPMIRCNCSPAAAPGWFVFFATSATYTAVCSGLRSICAARPASRPMPSAVTSMLTPRRFWTTVRTSARCSRPWTPVIENAEVIEARDPIPSTAFRAPPEIMESSEMIFVAVAMSLTLVKTPVSPAAVL